MINTTHLYRDGMWMSLATPNQTDPWFSWSFWIRILGVKWRISIQIGLNKQTNEKQKRINGSCNWRVPRHTDLRYGCIQVLTKCWLDSVSLHLSSLMFFGAAFICRQKSRLTFSRLSHPRGKGALPTPISVHTRPALWLNFIWTVILMCSSLNQLQWLGRSRYWWTRPGSCPFWPQRLKIWEEVAFPKGNQEPEEGATDAGEPTYKVRTLILSLLLLMRHVSVVPPLIWRTQPYPILLLAPACLPWTQVSENGGWRNNNAPYQTPCNCPFSEWPTTGSSSPSKTMAHSSWPFLGTIGSLRLM